MVIYAEKNLCLLLVELEYTKLVDLEKLTLVSKIQPRE
jgi:hypothetical protein